MMRPRTAERMHLGVRSLLTLLSVIAIAIASPALVQSTSQRPEKPTGSPRITGRVLARDNGAPLRRAHVQDPLSFFVEIEPLRSTFFTGDHFSVNVFSNRSQLANFVEVEIVAGDRVLLSHHLVVQMTRRVIRRQTP